MNETVSITLEIEFFNVRNKDGKISYVIVTNSSNKEDITDTVLGMGLLDQYIDETSSDEFDRSFYIRMKLRKVYILTGEVK